MTPLQTQLRRWRDAEAGMTDGLRECPFCGKHPHKDLMPDFFMVECRSGSCCNPSSGSWLTLDAAIAAWNTRAASPLTPALLDGLTELERLLTEMACEGEIVDRQPVHLPNCRKCAALTALTRALL